MAAAYVPVINGCRMYRYDSKDIFDKCITPRDKTKADFAGSSRFARVGRGQGLDVGLQGLGQGLGSGFGFRCSQSRHQLFALLPAIEWDRQTAIYLGPIALPGLGD